MTINNTPDKSKTVGKLKGKKKAPAYVAVYNRLRTLLNNGMFPIGSRLPSEPKLALMLDSNRDTLRQALALLREDKMIRTVRGAGNYVTLPNQAIWPGLNKLGNPVAKCLKDGYGKTKVEYHIEEVNEYARKLFNKELEEVVSSYQYYYREDKLVAYTFSSIDLGLLKEYDIHIKNNKNMWDFIDKKVYSLASRSHIELPLDVSTDMLWPENLKRGQRLTFMIEKIYREEFVLIACNKHYLLNEECVLSIDAS